MRFRDIREAVAASYGKEAGNACWFRALLLAQRERLVVAGPAENRKARRAREAAERRRLRKKSER